jgi:hypothetical protein
MEWAGLIPCLPEPNTEIYSEPDDSRPRTLIFFRIRFDIITW